MKKVSQDEFYRFIDSFGGDVSSYVSSMSEPPVRLYSVGEKLVAKYCVSLCSHRLTDCKPSRGGRGFESDWCIFE